MADYTAFQLIGKIGVEGAEQTKRQINSVKNTGVKASSDMTKAVKKLGAVLGTYLSAKAIINFGKTAVQVTADIEANWAAFNQIMVKTTKNGVISYSDKALDKLKTVSKQTGVTYTRLIDAMTSMTAKYKGMGKSIDESTDLATRSLVVATDISAFWNKSLDESIQLLNSFLNGETEAGRRIGLFANEMQLATYAVKRGIVEQTSDYEKLDSSMRQIIRLEFAEETMRQSGAVGQAKRESGEYLNVLGEMTNAYRQFLAEVGKPILNDIAIPAMQTMTDLFVKMRENAQSFADWAQKNNFGLGDFVNAGITVGVSLFLARGTIAKLVGAIATGLSAMKGMGIDPSGLALAVGTVGIQLVQTLNDKDYKEFASAIISGLIAGLATFGITGSVRGGMLMFSIGVQVNPIGRIARKILGEEEVDARGSIGATEDASGALEQIIRMVSQSGKPVADTLADYSRKNSDLSTSLDELLETLNSGLPDKGYGNWVVDQINSNISRIQSGQLSSRDLYYDKYMGSRTIPTPQSGSTGSPEDDASSDADSQTNPQNEPKYTTSDIDEMIMNYLGLFDDATQKVLTVTDTIDKLGEDYSALDKMIAESEESGNGKADALRSLQTSLGSKIDSIKSLDTSGMSLEEVSKEIAKILGQTEDLDDSVQTFLKDQGSMIQRAKEGQDRIDELNGKIADADKLYASATEEQKEYLDNFKANAQEEIDKIEESLDPVNKFIKAQGEFANQQKTVNQLIEEYSKKLEEAEALSSSEGLTEKQKETLGYIQENYSARIEELKNYLSTSKQHYMNFFEEIGEQMKRMDHSFGTWASIIDQIVNEIASEMQTVFGGLFTSIESMEEQTLQNELDILQTQYDSIEELNEKRLSDREEELEREKEDVQAYYDEGMIDRDEYIARLKALDADYESFKEELDTSQTESKRMLIIKQNELGKKQFKAEKANDIAQVAINTAVAITRAFRDLGWIGGTIASAFLTAQAGISTATILSKNYTETALAKGGVVDEPTHALIGEEGREAVVPLENNTGWADEVADAVYTHSAEPEPLGRIVSSLEQIRSVLREILTAQRNEQIVLDSGALVGEITPLIDQSLGDVNRLRTRGV